jgi:hypothetical protein
MRCRWLVLPLLLLFACLAVPVPATITEVVPRAQYTSTGGATYVFSWPIWAKVDLDVYVGDTLQTVDTQYTVTFTAGAAAGGTITFLSAPASGATVTILRRHPQERTSNFAVSGPFSVPALNSQLDRLTAQAQDLQEQVNRATKQAPHSTIPGRTMPDPANGSVLGWAAGQLTNLTLSGGAWDGLADLGSTDAGKGADLVANVAKVYDVTDYGATGDGVTDDRAAVDLATTAAAAAEGILWFPPGTYVMGSATSWDVSGVAKIDSPGATLDFTSGTASPVVICDGSRTSLATGLTLAEAATEITVSAGLDLPAGTPILITSVEAPPNPSRTVYYKGERVYVTSYSGTTLTVQPPLEFSYAASAYVWRSNETPLHVTRGITLSFPRGVARTGFRTKHADLRFEGTITGGGLSGLYVYSSRLRTFGAKIHDVHYTSTGNSYGIGIGDLSEADIVATEVLRARHCVDSGGGGYWYVEDSGGTGGTTASYPSKYRVTGGLFVSAPGLASYAISAHGNALDVVISGATIYGGVVMSGKRTLITGSSIYSWDHAAFGLGDDIWTGSSGWGYIKIVGSTIEKLGEAGIYGPIWVGGYPEEFEIRDSTVRGPINDSAEISQTYNKLLTLNGAEIGSVRLINSKFINTNKQAAVSRPSTIYFQESLVVDGCEIDDGLNITPQADAASIVIRDTKVSAPGWHGVFVGQKAGETYQLAEIVVDGLTVEGAYNTGITVTEAAKARVRNSILRNSGQQGSGATSARVGAYMKDVDEIVLEHNDLRDTQASATQLYGLSVSGVDTGTLTYDLTMIGNDLRGNATGSRLLAGTATVLMQYGNLADTALRTILPAGTLPTYADNTAALAGGLTAGTLYRTSAGAVLVVYTP